jgi:two-component system, sensor histidine kinase PdtaS
MASIAELARSTTRLGRPEIDHLQRLVATWGLLADLCFADLMLFVGSDHHADGSRAQGPVEDRPLVVLGQIRPTTSQTLFLQDWVGRVVPADERPFVARCLAAGTIMEGESLGDVRREPVRELCIPVTFRGRTIGVLTKESTPTVGRQPGELERTYVEVFHRFARMVASGEFPFAGELGPSEEAPRVGDGVILLDRTMRVAYASPNGVSALHRVGVHANSEGMRLGELGLPETAMRTAYTQARPATEEIEQGPEITVLMRFIPLVEKGVVSGALVLLRDISELRRRDRLLLSKDATIREIHHRVKNNLQTISSLLRLQGRRLASREAKAAIEESVRRIRSIALVHETLSHEAGDDVPFLEIVRPLVRMVEEGLISPEHPIRFTIRGDAGNLPATVATPMAVAVTELLQNVVDHAYPDGTDGSANVRVDLANDGQHLSVTVADDGIGPPERFSVEASTGLGLSIVRTLVTTELGGTIEFRPGDGPTDRPGTTVRLVVPMAQ